MKGFTISSHFCFAAVILANKVANGFSTNQRKPRSLVAPVSGQRIPINEAYPGLEKVHADPDVFVIKDFLPRDACQDLISCAKEKKLDQSPVAYAGWTEDFKDLFELSAKGPVAWLAILVSWYQVNSDGNGVSQVDLIGRMIQNFGLFLVLAVVLIGIFTKVRTDGLQELRTSTSTTIDDLRASEGAATFVREAASLLSVDDRPKAEASLFEAPTIIRYEAGQALAPHYDANRAATVEDANRGGQTLATLIVYLNNVESGGLTRFGKLTSSQNGEPDKSVLTVKPRLGDALLFFPADRQGGFDEMTEHEGCPAVDEKWIARIWRHENRVPTPFGLSETELARV